MNCTVHYTSWQQSCLALPSEAATATATHEEELNSYSCVAVAALKRSLLLHPASSKAAKPFLALPA